ncbi:MAG TPA: hypothetical protein VMZ53_31985 [Kofleriaceae bacterium]|nr:hypothetical protein [Kofleriaceae bacterium]
MLARLVPIAFAAMLLTAGCEKTDHATIDKWMGTKKGPSKLKKTLVDDSLDPDLSAHAAANMIKKGRDQEVRTELDNMSVPRKQAIVGKLAPRLWEMARIEGEMMMPAPQQVQAKDALVSIRKYADTPMRTTIDGYLIDWYTVPSYEGRSKAGAVLGEAVMRMVGPGAAKKLMRVADGIIAAPGQDKTKKRIGDQLLLGLAATGDPDAVKYILDIAKMDRGDETLAKRALGALYTAYVDPQGLFDLQEPGALVPNLDQLVSIAKSDSMDPAAANSAVALIRVVGPPQCLQPLVSMIAHPHPDPRFRYFGPDAALKCGGVKAIKQVIQAMPDQAYEKVKLEGTVVLDITKMSPRDQVLAELRDLLNDKSRMARWVAIETLAAMKSKEDAPAIAKVKGGEKLLGFWGDQSGTDPAARKSDPTLAQRAKELSDALQKAP